MSTKQCNVHWQNSYPHINPKSSHLTQNETKFMTEKGQFHLLLRCSSNNNMCRPTTVWNVQNAYNNNEYESYLIDTH